MSTKPELIDAGDRDVAIYIPYLAPDDTKLSRERDQASLEREYGLAFRHAIIHPGADLESFVTLIMGHPWAPAIAAVTLFLNGKKIQENFDAWIKLCAKIRSFFGRKVSLSRDAAAVVALAEYVKTRNAGPASVKLLGYKAALDEDVDAVGRVSASSIEDNVSELYISKVVHVFTVDVAGARRNIVVDGERVMIFDNPK